MSEPIPSVPEEASARIDLWLWAVRLHKTRSQAASACRNNQITVNGASVKPSRQVRAGDTVTAKQGLLTKTVKVLGILEKRVGPKAVPEFLEDQTPPEVYEQAASISRANRESRPRRESGAGRPTKKERRDLEEVMAEAEAEVDFHKSMLQAHRKHRKQS